MKPNPDELDSFQYTCRVYALEGAQDTLYAQFFRVLEGYYFQSCPERISAFAKSSLRRIASMGDF